MANSMTAFARHETRCDLGLIVWELRSVNHRFLELSIRLPEPLRSLESTLREQVKRKLNRGKVECALNFYPDAAVATSLSINEALVTQLIHALKPIQTRLETAALSMAGINSMDILRWPDVVQPMTQWSESVNQQVIDSFSIALDELVQARIREGMALHGALEGYLQQMDTILATLMTHLPHILQREREKWQSRIVALQLELDVHRLEQELVILAQKMDVTEEMTRFTVHIQEVRRVLKSDGSVGRRLDFLLQEMQREANTLGSKAVDVTTSHFAVDLKVLIEQVREQVQNIE